MSELTKEALINLRPTDKQVTAWKEGVRVNAQELQMACDMALRSLTQPATAGEWRPIVDAPRDGKYILAYGKPNGMFNNEGEKRQCIIYWVEDPNNENTHGWHEGVLAAHWFNHQDWRPTHWMPLSSAPTEKERPQ